ncbi:MAG TPA: ferrochelatase [Bacilli bacterium]
MHNRRIGVLVMSYGTPESMEQIEAYYTHIRHGHKPSPELLGELTSRYEAIVGGVFPLRENTNRQVSALQETLDRMYPNYSFVCYQGLKHAAPFIEDGVKQMAADGLREAVGIVLAPHYSTMSVGDYTKRARETAVACGIRMNFVDQYHLHPDLLSALANRVRAGLAGFGEQADRTEVIFSAHSLPAKILEANDPYPQQLLETSQAVAERAGVAKWRFAWQSAGRTAEPWLGPDILDVLETIRGEGIEHVLVCPVGFVSDHLEVLYDIDIECKQKAAKLGIHLERTASLNTDPLYMKTLAESVVAKIS